MTTELLRLRVPCDARAPAAVRKAMREVPALAGVLEDALLVAGELVTNAVRHSRGTEAELLTVRVTASGAIRIYIEDPGAAGGDAEVAERPPQLGGMGLKIVRALSNAWGTERERNGYTVWAELRGPI